MSDEEINIAIAEACGWVEVVNNRKYHQCPTGFPPNSKGNLAYIPDYCGDLNAIHKAEEKLTNEQLDFYCNILHKPNHGIYWAIHATARQRAEAFLRVIGKLENNS